MASELWQRIKAARRHASLTQDEVAQMLNLTRPAVAQWESKNPETRTSPSRANLNAFSELTGAPMDWLTDDGQDATPYWIPPGHDEGGLGEIAVMRASDQRLLLPDEGTREASLIRAARADRPKLTVENEEREALVRLGLAMRDQFVFVPLLDVTAAAGSGSTDATPRILKYMAYRRDWLVGMMDLDPAASALIVARGDSMEPDIRSGELLLLDLRSRVVTDPGVYVLALSDGEYVVKWVEKGWDGTLHVSSRNPAYRAWSVPAKLADQLTVVGRVRAQQRRV